MKTKLLLLLVVSIMGLPQISAQLLTPIPDTTHSVEPEEKRSSVYITGGYSLRVITGYQQMYDFYEKQGFEVERAQEFLTVGVGFRFWDRYHLDLNADRSFMANSPEDIKLANGHVLSIQEQEIALHLLLGYRFWEKDYKSLTVHSGVSYLQNKAEIAERRPQDFDFNTANINTPQGVRSWPVFLHQQGALHFALQLKLKYPRPRWWWRADIDMKVGFVTGLQSKPWSIDPGQSLNVPSDRAQYFYASNSIYF